MPRIRNTLATMVATGAMLLGSLAVAAPAEAATGYDRCPHGSFCLFSGENGTGTIGIFKWGSPDLRQQGLNNNVRSLWNRSGNKVIIYKDFNYVHPYTSHRPYGAPNPVSEFHGHQISSARAV